MSTRLLREMNYATVTDGLIIFILRRKVSLLDLHFSLQGASPQGNRRKVISHRLLIELSYYAISLFSMFFCFSRLLLEINITVNCETLD